MSRRHFDLAIPEHRHTLAAAVVCSVIVPTSGKTRDRCGGPEFMITDRVMFRVLGLQPSPGMITLPEGNPL